jgi:hypothetical protein
MYKECRHIRTCGGRCRCAALPGENFCFYHLNQRKQTAAPSAAPEAGTKNELQLPPLEDRLAVQTSIDRVLAALASGLIHPRNAGLYLYGIQLAAANLAHFKDSELEAADPVRRVVLTRQGEHIAEARTIAEDEDLDEIESHKKNCKCEKCVIVETDKPHHPDCACGECHFFVPDEDDDENEEETDQDEIKEPTQNKTEKSGRKSKNKGETLTIHACAATTSENARTRSCGGAW